MLCNQLSFNDIYNLYNNLIFLTNQMSFIVYILELADSHYYVGRTNITNLSKRIAAHKKGKGSSWTSLHKFIRVKSVHNTDNIFMEDYATKRLMLKHGINKVRGGAYSMITLPDFQIRALRYELRSCAQLCYKCGSNTHFVSRCNL